MSTSHPPSVMPCEEAVELATHAVEADIAGDVAKAIEFYTRAADALDRAASVTPAEAAEMRGKSSEYRKRVGVLQGKLQMAQMEAMAQSAQMAQQGAQIAGQTNAAVKTAGRRHVAARRRSARWRARWCSAR